MAKTKVYERRIDLVKTLSIIIDAAEWPSMEQTIGMPDWTGDATIMLHETTMSDSFKELSRFNGKAVDLLTGIPGAWSAAVGFPDNVERFNKIWGIAVSLAVESHMLTLMEAAIDQVYGAVKLPNLPIPEMFAWDV